MLIVRHVQLRQLQTACHDWLLDRLTRYVAAQHPAVALLTPAAELRRDLGRLLGRATAYGFASSTDLQRYLDLSIAYGWDFEASPGNEWMSFYLRDPDVSSPGQRLALLLDECRYRTEAENEDQRWPSAATLMQRHLPERS